VREKERKETKIVYIAGDWEEIVVRESVKKN
jgi:hypothetical protein